MRWLWNETAEVLPLYPCLSHPQEVFPGCDGRSCFEPSQCSCAYLLVGAAPQRSIAPCSGHRRQHKALPTASAWFPKCWHSLGWGLKITTQWWDDLSYAENESSASPPSFHCVQSLFLLFFSLTQTHIYIQILIQLPVQPITWAIAALKSINYEWFCFEIGAVLNNFCSII